MGLDPIATLPEGRAAASHFRCAEESPGSTEQRCRVTPGGPAQAGSGTVPQKADRLRLRPGKGERVRQERTAGPATGTAWQTPPGARPNRGGIWALFRLVARVGCWRLSATAAREEWPHSPARGGQNPAYRPSGATWERCAPQRGRAGEAMPDPRGRPAAPQRRLTRRALPASVVLTPLASRVALS